MLRRLLKLFVLLIRSFFLSRVAVVACFINLISFSCKLFLSRARSFNEIRSPTKTITDFFFRPITNFLFYCLQEYNGNILIHSIIHHAVDNNDDDGCGKKL